MSEFNRMEQRMDQMLQSFGMGSMGMPPAIMGPPSHNQRRPQQQQQPQQQHRSNQQQMMPFSGLGGSMFENMFGNMNAMMVSVIT